MKTKTLWIFSLIFLCNQAMTRAVEPVESNHPPILGVAGALHLFSDGDTGVKITAIIRGFPATKLRDTPDESAGFFKLVAGTDVIVGLAAQDIKNFLQLQEVLDSLPETERTYEIRVRSLRTPGGAPSESGVQTFFVKLKGNPQAAN